MVRKVLFYLEIWALAALQVAFFVSLGWTAAAVFAQSSPTSRTAKPPSNPDIVQDFMASLPQSDNMRRNASYNAEDRHPFQTGSATYRIYNHKNAAAKQALLLQAQTAFTAECSAKGGVIAPRDSRDYAMTIERLRPPAPDGTILICIRPNRTALGMLITLKRTVRPGQSTGDLSESALDLVFGGGAPYYLVALLPPPSVYTPERLDREAAELAATQQRQAAERDRIAEQERIEVERWRRTIQPGTETGCGPVLRVNGDLIELAYVFTREPKWYRRGELWPPLYSPDGVAVRGGRSCK